MPIDHAPQYIAAARFTAMMGDSLATFYRRLSGGYFPPPIRFGPRAVKWNLATVSDYLAASERVGRLLKRVEWEAIQTAEARQQKQTARTMRTSEPSNRIRHDSRAVEVSA